MSINYSYQMQKQPAREEASLAKQRNNSWISQKQQSSNTQMNVGQEYVIFIPTLAKNFKGEAIQHHTQKRRCSSL